jgi:hypothetical protein
LGAGASPPEASAAAFDAVDFRVARGFVVDPVSVDAAVEAAVSAAEPEAAAFDAVVRRARGLAAGASATGASPAATEPPSSAAVAFGARVERLPAGLRVDRVALGAGAAPATSAASITGSGARLGAGFWATCARSMASSSGGTSLHGSLEVTRGADGAGWRPTGRSSRV